MGRVHGLRTPPPPLGFSNTTGILPKKMWFTGIHQSVTPVLSGAPPPKKNPGSAPAVYPEYSRIPWRRDSIFEAVNTTIFSLERDVIKCQIYLHHFLT